MCADANVQGGEDDRTGTCQGWPDARDGSGVAGDEEHGGFRYLGGRKYEEADDYAVQ